MNNFNKKYIIIWIIAVILIWSFFLYRQSNLDKLHNVDNSPTATNNNAVCVEEYNPVCWIDNKTHSSECVATKIDNVQVQYKWQCREEVKTEDTTSDSTDIKESNSWGSVDLNDSTNNTWTIDNSWTGTIDNSWSIITQTASWEKLQTYSNSNYNYWFSLPYNTFFAWYWAKWWANHAVWINTWTWIDNFEESTVKVFFYKAKIIDELKDSSYWLYEDKPNGRTYLKLNNNSVIIEALPWSETIVQTIIKTIYAN